MMLLDSCTVLGIRGGEGSGWVCLLTQHCRLRIKHREVRRARDRDIWRDHRGPRRQILTGWLRDIEAVVGKMRVGICWQRRWCHEVLSARADFGSYRIAARGKRLRCSSRARRHHLGTIQQPLGDITAEFINGMGRGVRVELGSSDRERPGWAHVWSAGWSIWQLSNMVRFRRKFGVSGRKVTLRGEKVRPRTDVVQVGEVKVLLLVYSLLNTGPRSSACSD
jgi:hypothetical protein